MLPPSPSSTLHRIEMALVLSFTSNNNGLIYVALCVARPVQLAPHHITDDGTSHRTGQRLGLIQQMESKTVSTHGLEK